MKKLIVARHGSYGEDMRISSAGREQMVKLAETLKKHIDGCKVVMLSSSAPRAADSAEVLAGLINVPFKEYEVLWSDNRHRRNDQAVLDLIESKKGDADVVIIVTHIEYTDSFPSFYARKVLNAQIFSYGIGKGEAQILDCGQKTIQIVRRD